MFSGYKEQLVGKDKDQSRQRRVYAMSAASLASVSRVCTATCPLHSTDEPKVEVMRWYHPTAVYPSILHYLHEEGGVICCCYFDINGHLLFVYRAIFVSLHYDDKKTWMMATRIRLLAGPLFRTATSIYIYWLVYSSSTVVVPFVRCAMDLFVVLDILVDSIYLRHHCHHRRRSGPLDNTSPANSFRPYPAEFTRLRARGRVACKSLR